MDWLCLVVTRYNSKKRNNLTGLNFEKLERFQLKWQFVIMQQIFTLAEPYFNCAQDQASKHFQQVLHPDAPGTFQQNRTALRLVVA